MGGASRSTDVMAPVRRQCSGVVAVASSIDAFDTVAPKVGIAISEALMRLFNMAAHFSANVNA